MSSTLNSTSLTFTGPNMSIVLSPTNTDLIISGNVTITSTTNSVSPTTGALLVSGGLGVQQNLFVSGNIIPSTIDYFIIGSGTNQSVSNNSTAEVTTYYNGGFSASSGSIITHPSAGRLHVNTTGIYLYTANLLFLENNNGYRQFWFTTVNPSLGESSKIKLTTILPPTNNSKCGVSISTIVQLFADTYISAFVYQTSGGSLSLGGSGSNLLTSLLKIN